MLPGLYRYVLGRYVDAFSSSRHLRCSRCLFEQSVYIFVILGNFPSSESGVRGFRRLHHPQVTALLVSPENSHEILSVLFFCEHSVYGKYKLCRIKCHRFYLNNNRRQFTNRSALGNQKLYFKSNYF